MAENNDNKFVYVPVDNVVSQCALCKHKTLPGNFCTAFPDGIPILIMDNDIKHDVPYPGDNGIQFEPRE